MNKEINMKKIVLIVSITLAFLSYGNFAHAQSGLNDEADAKSVIGNENDIKASAEVEVKDYKPRQNNKDPFQALIAPPTPVVTPAPVKEDIGRPPVKEIQPLPLKVTFVVGGPNRKFANICLNDRVNQYTDGEQEESGLFKVIEILDRSVKIWDSRLNKERLLNLGE